MQIIEDINKLRKVILQHKKSGKTIGLVTTMGFLHQGHASLIKLARLQCDIVIVSIFVNPLQFGKSEDLATYPRDLAGDSKLCETNSVDILFIPQATQLTDKLHTYVNVSLLDTHLCGASRKGHFQGVCTILTKLFNLVQPDTVYYGKKDIQQLRVVEQFVKDLNFPITVIGGETFRDNDGLALSSRNSYLSSRERQSAVIVPQTLKYILQLIQQQKIIECKKLIELASIFVQTEKLAKIDYIEIVDDKILQPVVQVDQPVVIALAIFIGKTRLIDNYIYKIDRIDDVEPEQTKYIPD